MIPIALLCQKKESYTDLVYSKDALGTILMIDPFPEPIRVSVGLTVTGLSGKIRTHIFPPRRAFRVIARRPASICLDVIQAGSSA